MMKSSNFWQKLTIKNKIAAFTGAVLIIIVVAVLFDAWIVKYFMMDFNAILDDNACGDNIINVLKEESSAFVQYVESPSVESRGKLKECIENTNEVMYAIPMDYNHLGETRYAQLQSIRSSYEVYGKARDEIMNGLLKGASYIGRLYEIYEMQEYLHQYAQVYMATTLEEGNARYQELLPSLFMVPIAAIAVSILLIFIIIHLAMMMNETIIDPVLNLANASRRIAANDFYIEDVETNNQDEIGELVKAFNKMKYATGEYISALEEKREALDRLHTQELEKLEVDKQLESMNLELLKSQINPHFLFNTLNVIGGMANLEDAETTEQMIVALSSLFRYNLKTQETEVILSRELKVAQDYMYLQKMRFGSRVEYEMDCSIDAEKPLVPTFTLQPLLENSIIHGLSPKLEGGKITLTITEQGNFLHIIIADTGVGMSREEQEKLINNIQSSNSQKAGIGVGNVYRRITRMYDGGNMIINSEKNKGTVIEIVIPYHTEPVNV
ncbi:MAG: sensor histidine kinase [Lachnospiraceae bacterium]